RRLQWIPLAQLVLTGGRSMGRLGRLRTSLAQINQIHPIIVRKEPDGVGFTVLDGSRRVEAARANGQKRILALVLELDEVEAALVSIDSNLGLGVRKSLTLIETCDALVHRQELIGRLGVGHRKRKDCADSGIAEKDCSP